MMRLSLLALFVLLMHCVSHAGLPVLVQPGDKIVTFGDSISNGKGYGFFAVELMNAERPDLKLTWVGKGYPGWLSSGGATVVQQVLAEKPTLVTVMFGTNDLGNMGARGIAEFPANMRSIVRQLKAAGVRVVLLTTPYMNDRNGADRWVRSLNREAAPYMAQQLFALAKEEDVPVLDIFSGARLADEAAKKKDPAFTMFQDGVHPNEAGHRLMARILADFLLGKSAPPRTKCTWKYTGKPSANAVKLPAADVMAGPLAWPANAPAMVLEREDQVNDPVAWKNLQGLSARAFAGWDANTLYLTVQVTDDVVLAGKKQPDWGSDGIEFFFDARPRKERTIAFAPGYFQMLVAVSEQDGPAPVDCGRMDKFDTTSLKATCRRTPAGYILDIAIPWTTLRFTPKAGADLGFDFAINDRDFPDKPRYKALWRGNGDDFNNAGDLGVIKLK